MVRVSDESFGVINNVLMGRLGEAKYPRHTQYLFYEYCENMNMHILNNVQCFNFGSEKFGATIQQSNLTEACLQRIVTLVYVTNII